VTDGTVQQFALWNPANSANWLLAQPSSLLERDHERAGAVVRGGHAREVHGKEHARAGRGRGGSESGSSTFGKLVGQPSS
jgi:hypothetical protein